MYKITETYTDYDGNERTEDLYFNLTEAEVIKFMTTNSDYTLDRLLLKLTKTGNIREVMEIFEKFIYEAYGEKSLDGRRFVKSKEVKDNFIETEAYSKLFMRLISDEDEAAKFINSVIPSTLAEKVDLIMSKNPGASPEELMDRVYKSAEIPTA